MSATHRHAEQLRAAAEHAGALLQAEPQPDLDGLVALAAHVTGAPVALLNLVEDGRVWHVATEGHPRGSSDGEGALCTAVVRSGAPLHLPDAQTDEVWGESPRVRAEGVRMYAAAPLVADDSGPLGTLCVLDPQPRTLSIEQLGALAMLADQAVALLESRRRARALHAAVDELDRLAHVDGLTGLVNRSAASRALARLCATGGWGVLFIDVDGFKAVNDQTGHAGGDAVLRTIGRRLRAGLRPHDLLARWAGDEFLALLAGPVTEAEVAAVVARVKDSVRTPYALDGRELALSVSVGGLVVEAGSEPADVLRTADRAMYEDKRRRVPV